MDHRENKKRRRGLPNQMNLVIHIVAGGYLMYLAYGVYNEAGKVTGGERIVFGLTAILFVTAGAVAVFSALRSLMKGEYRGGAADLDKDEAESGESPEASKSDRIRFGEQEKRKESGEAGRIRFGEPDTLPKGNREEAESEKGNSEDMQA